MLLMLCGLLLAQANGLAVPDACWIVFGIQAILGVAVGVVKAVSD